MTIFSLGHSTLEPAEFAAAARGIDVIVDVRSHPGSRHVPQFNKEQMEQWLPEYGLAYEWWPSLGGWTAADAENVELKQQMAQRGVDINAYSRGVFPRQRIGVDRPDSDPDRPSWTNQGLYDYAWYTSLPNFQVGADHLWDRFGDDINCAIVCCEALWWKCHRSMIADWLVFHGHDCLHLPIKPPKREATPRWKSHWASIGDRLERYPREVLATWNT